MTQGRFARPPPAKKPAKGGGAAPGRLLGFGLALLATGCANLFEAKKPPPPCPAVLVLEDAGTLLRYRPGPGRDITDTSFEGKIVRIAGECDYGKRSVVLDVEVVFELTLGPANPGRVVRFEYFVAIPQFHPRPEGKRRFPIGVPFPDRRTRLWFTDRLELEIPIARGKRGTDYDVYLGFQLTREELERNRKSRAR